MQTTRTRVWSILLAFIMLLTMMPITVLATDTTAESGPVDDPTSTVSGPTGIDEKGKVIYQMSEKEERTPVYLPVGAFITAWARDYTIRAAQANYVRFLYADTDSLHLLGTELPDNLRIDPYELGAWKHELTFKRAKYIRAKSYVEETEEKLKITCAGLPKSSYEYVTFDNFEKGAEYQGKRTKKRVAGGVILVDTTFKIKS